MKDKKADSGKSYGVWSFGGYRHLRGRLARNERYFTVKVELGGRQPIGKEFVAIRGVLDKDDKYILLRDCHVSSEESKVYSKDKIRSRLTIDSYLKLEHTSPIKKLMFSSLEVDLPNKLHYKQDLSNRFMNGGIRLGEESEPDIILYESRRYKVGIRTDMRVSPSNSKLTAELSSRRIISYKKPQNINTITRDFNKIRNLIAICSYFHQSINMDSINLFYSSDFNYKKETPVEMSSTGNRVIQLDTEKDNDVPAWWLFSKFLDKPQEVFAKYFSLLDNQEFQYVIDVYLGHFRPSKAAGVTLEFQFLAAIQLLEATYERLIEDNDAAMKRTRAAYQCDCDNTYCEKCTKLDLPKLSDKLRTLVKLSIGDNDKYKDFAKLAYGDIAYTRNYHTHGKKNSHRSLMSARDMHRTVIKLEFIFLYILFKELGYSNDELDKTLTYLSPFNWV